MAGESKESDAQSLLKLLAEKEKEIDKLKQDIELLTKVSFIAFNLVYSKNAPRTVC